MRFVHYVYLVVAAAAHEGYTLAYIADVIDARIGGGVDLDDIRGVASGDLAARDAFIAGFAVVRVGAVDGLRQQARRAGLAGATRTTEQVGVGQPPIAHGVEQRPRDGLLPDQVGEGL